MGFQRPRAHAFRFAPVLALVLTGAAHAAELGLGGWGQLTYGGRMPLKRAKPNEALIEIIRLWIEAGAPETGWVPGTD